MALAVLRAQVTQEGARPALAARQAALLTLLATHQPPTSVQMVSLAFRRLSAVRRPHTAVLVVGGLTGPGLAELVGRAAAAREQTPETLARA